MGITGHGLNSSFPQRFSAGDGGLPSKKAEFQFPKLKPGELQVKNVLDAVLFRTIAPIRGYDTPAATKALRLFLSTNFSKVPDQFSDQLLCFFKTYCREYPTENRPEVMAALLKICCLDKSGMDGAKRLRFLEALQKFVDWTVPQDEDGKRFAVSVGRELLRLYSVADKPSSPPIAYHPISVYGGTYATRQVNLAELNAFYNVAGLIKDSARQDMTRYLARAAYLGMVLPESPLRLPEPQVPDDRSLQLKSTSWVKKHSVLDVLTDPIHTKKSKEQMRSTQSEYMLDFRYKDNNFETDFDTYSTRSSISTDHPSNDPDELVDRPQEKGAASPDTVKNLREELELRLDQLNSQEKVFHIRLKKLQELDQLQVSFNSLKDRVDKHPMAKMVERPDLDFRKLNSYCEVLLARLSDLESRSSDVQSRMKLELAQIRDIKTRMEQLVRDFEKDKSAFIDDQNEYGGPVFLGEVDSVSEMLREILDLTVYLKNRLVEISEEKDRINAQLLKLNEQDEESSDRSSRFDLDHTSDTLSSGSIDYREVELSVLVSGEQVENDEKLDDYRKKLEDGIAELTAQLAAMDDSHKKLEAFNQRSAELHNRADELEQQEIRRVFQAFLERQSQVFLDRLLEQIEQDGFTLDTPIHLPSISDRVGDSVPDGSLRVRFNAYLERYYTDFVGLYDLDKLGQWGSIATLAKQVNVIRTRSAMVLQQYIKTQKLDRLDDQKVLDDAKSGDLNTVIQNMIDRMGGSDEKAHSEIVMSLNFIRKIFDDISDPGNISSDSLLSNLTQLDDRIVTFLKLISSSKSVSSADHRVLNGLAQRLVRELQERYPIVNLVKQPASFDSQLPQVSVAPISSISTSPLPSVSLMQVSDANKDGSLILPAYPSSLHSEASWDTVLTDSISYCNALMMLQDKHSAAFLESQYMRFVEQVLPVLLQKINTTSSFDRIQSKQLQSITKLCAQYYRFALKENTHRPLSRGEIQIRQFTMYAGLACLYSVIQRSGCPIDGSKPNSSQQSAWAFHLKEGYGVGTAAVLADLEMMDASLISSSGFDAVRQYFMELDQQIRRVTPNPSAQRRDASSSAINQFDLTVLTDPRPSKSGNSSDMTGYNQTFSSTFALASKIQWMGVFSTRLFCSDSVLMCKSSSSSPSTSPRPGALNDAVLAVSYPKPDISSRGLERVSPNIQIMRGSIRTPDGEYAFPDMYVLEPRPTREIPFPKKSYWAKSEYHPGSPAGISTQLQDVKLATALASTQGYTEPDRAILEILASPENRFTSLLAFFNNRPHYLHELAYQEVLERFILDVDSMTTHPNHSAHLDSVQMFLNTHFLHSKVQSFEDAGEVSSSQQLLTDCFFVRLILKLKMMGIALPDSLLGGVQDRWDLIRQQLRDAIETIDSRYIQGDDAENMPMSAEDTQKYHILMVQLESLNALYLMNALLLNSSDKADTSKLLESYRQLQSSYAVLTDSLLQPEMRESMPPALKQAIELAGTMTAVLLGAEPRLSDRFKDNLLLEINSRDSNLHKNLRDFGVRFLKPIQLSDINSRGSYVFEVQLDGHELVVDLLANKAYLDGTDISGRDRDILHHPMFKEFQKKMPKFVDFKPVTVNGNQGKHYKAVMITSGDYSGLVFYLDVRSGEMRIYSPEELPDGILRGEYLEPGRYVSEKELLDKKVLISEVTDPLCLFWQDLEGTVTGRILDQDVVKISDDRSGESVETSVTHHSFGKLLSAGADATSLLAYFTAGLEVEYWEKAVRIPAYSLVLNREDDDLVYWHQGRRWTLSVEQRALHHRHLVFRNDTDQNRLIVMGDSESGVGLCHYLSTSDLRSDMVPDSRMGQLILTLDYLIQGHASDALRVFSSMESESVSALEWETVAQTLDRWVEKINSNGRIDDMRCAEMLLFVGASMLQKLRLPSTDAGQLKRDAAWRRFGHFYRKYCEHVTDSVLNSEVKMQLRSLGFEKLERSINRQLTALFDSDRATCLADLEKMETEQVSEKSVAEDGASGSLEQDHVRELRDKLLEIKASLNSYSARFIALKESDDTQLTAWPKLMASDAVSEKLSQSELALFDKSLAEKVGGVSDLFGVESVSLGVSGLPILHSSYSDPLKEKLENFKKQKVTIQNDGLPDLRNRLQELMHYNQGMVRSLGDSLLSWGTQVLPYSQAILRGLPPIRTPMDVVNLLDDTDLRKQLGISAKDKRFQKMYKIAIRYMAMLSELGHCRRVLALVEDLQTDTCFNKEEKIKTLRDMVHAQRPYKIQGLLFHSPDQDQPTVIQLRAAYAGLRIEAQRESRFRAQQTEAIRVQKALSERGDLKSVKTVIEAPTGSGKTSFMMAYYAREHLLTGDLVHVRTTPNLVHAAAQELRDAGFKVQVFHFDQSQKFNPAYLQSVLELFESARESGTVLVESFNSVKYFEASYKALLHAGNENGVDSVIRCLEMMTSIQRLPHFEIVDETDKTQDPTKSSVNIEFGKEVPVTGLNHGMGIGMFRELLILKSRWPHLFVESKHQALKIKSEADFKGPLFDSLAKLIFPKRAEPFHRLLKSYFEGDDENNQAVVEGRGADRFELSLNVKEQLMLLVRNDPALESQIEEFIQICRQMLVALVEQDIEVQYGLDLASGVLMASPKLSPTRVSKGWYENPLVESVKTVNLWLSLDFGSNSVGEARVAGDRIYEGFLPQLLSRKSVVSDMASLKTILGGPENGDDREWNELQEYLIELKKISGRYPDSKQSQSVLMSRWLNDDTLRNRFQNNKIFRLFAAYVMNSTRTKAAFRCSGSRSACWSVSSERAQRQIHLSATFNMAQMPAYLSQEHMIQSDGLFESVWGQLLQPENQGVDLLPETIAFTPDDQSDALFSLFSNDSQKSSQNDSKNAYLVDLASVYRFDSESAARRWIEMNLLIEPFRYVLYFHPVTGEKMLLDPAGKAEKYEVLKPTLKRGEVMSPVIPAGLHEGLDLEAVQTPDQRLIITVNEQTDYNAFVQAIGRGRMKQHFKLAISPSFQLKIQEMFHLSAATPVETRHVARYLFDRYQDELQQQDAIRNLDKQLEEYVADLILRKDVRTVSDVTQLVSMRQSIRFELQSLGSMSKSEFFNLRLEKFLAKINTIDAADLDQARSFFERVQTQLDPFIGDTVIERQASQQDDVAEVEADIEQEQEEEQEEVAEHHASESNMQEEKQTDSSEREFSPGASVLPDRPEPKSVVAAPHFPVSWAAIQTGLTVSKSGVGSPRQSMDPIVFSASNPIAAHEVGGHNIAMDQDLDLTGLGLESLYFSRNFAYTTYSHTHSTAGKVLVHPQFVIKFNGRYVVITSQEMADLRNDPAFLNALSSGTVSVIDLWSSEVGAMIAESLRDATLTGAESRTSNINLHDQEMMIRLCMMAGVVPTGLATEDWMAVITKRFDSLIDKTIKNVYKSKLDNTATHDQLLALNLGNVNLILQWGFALTRNKSGVAENLKIQVNRAGSSQTCFSKTIPQKSSINNQLFNSDDHSLIIGVRPFSSLSNGVHNTVLPVHPIRRMILSTRQSLALMGFSLSQIGSHPTILALTALEVKLKSKFENFVQNDGSHDGRAYRIVGAGPASSSVSSAS